MRIFICAGLLVAVSAWSATAALIDDLNTTNNFFGHFGGAITSNTAPGEVTIFRVAPIVDTGVDWQHNGASGPRLSLDPLDDEGTLTIVPVTPVNGGFYTVQILFFNSGSFVSENTLIPDTNSTAIQMHDIIAFQQSLSLVADEYNVRFRIGPSALTDPGFTFTQLNALSGPEPSVAALGLVGAAIGWAARKRAAGISRQ